MAGRPLLVSSATASADALAQGALAYYPGPIAYANAGTALDMSGGNLDGKLYNGVTTVTGKRGDAFHFNGTNQYISLGNPTVLNFTGKITISAWVKPEATDGTRNIVVHGHSTSPNGEVGLRIGSGQYQIYSCLLYTSPSPRDGLLSRMPSSA